MTDYKKLVDALRCGEYKPECGSSDCTYWSGLGCMDGQLMEDAADAIEALDRLLDQNTERCEALRKQLREAHESYEKHLNELESQLPKRGEWVELADRNERKYSHTCSNCHRFHIHEGEIEFYHYCPNCGAKMEVQDG